MSTETAPTTRAELTVNLGSEFTVSSTLSGQDSSGDQAGSDA